MHSPAPLAFPGRLIRVVLSYGIAGACLYWVFHDLNLRELWESFSKVNWSFIFPAMLLDLLVYVIAGWEWKILLLPVGRLSVFRTTQAVFAGRFANDVLPVHVGYVVRLYLVSRWMPAKVASLAPSLFVERLFDGFWLALGIGLTGAFFPLPGKIAGVAKLWAGIIGLGIVAGIFIVFRRPRRAAHPGAGASPTTWTQKMRSAMEDMLQQIRTIGRSWVALAGFGLSFAKFAVQGLAFLFVLWACRFHFPFWTQLAVFLVAYVGISMPSTPASVGVFQLFCIGALQMFQIPKPAAAGFALLAFAVLTLPLSVAGFFALAHSGMTLRRVRAEAAQWKMSEK